MRRIMEDGRDDLQLAGTRWLAECPANVRSAMLEQRDLRQRGLRKHVRAREMLFTALGLQQMTTEVLARYKAGRFPIGTRTLADLCCGLGGDSFHLPRSISVMGVDKNRETLRAYRHNMELFRPAWAIEADVTKFHARVDGIILDPARRGLDALRSSRDFNEEPEPGWDALADLVRKFRNTVIKLGPGTRLPEVLAEEEQEYIGLNDECLELSVRTGDFGHRGMVRAVELPEGAEVSSSASDIPDSFGRVEPPGGYFYEPVKCLVRSHLFGVVAQREGLWQLDGRIAYLSGNKKVETPLLKRYRFVDVFPCDEAVLRREVVARDIGILEIKKRGLEIDPDAWRKRLRPQGSQTATLVFTRVQEKGCVLWVERD